MASGKAVENRHSQIAQDIEDDVFHTVWEVTVRLHALHTAKHQTTHAVEAPSQLQVGQHAIDGVQPFPTVL